MCLPPGMPRAMVAYEAMELVVLRDLRPVDTSTTPPHLYGRTGRRMSSRAGYSIGKWIDEDGDGRYNGEVGARNFKGPRTFDESGCASGQSDGRQERIYLIGRSVLHENHDQRPCLDEALTVTRNYRREPIRSGVARGRVLRKQSVSTFEG
jgi:hypothetical protein